jgi:hypothetical protein
MMVKTQNAKLKCFRACKYIRNFGPLMFALVWCCVVPRILVLVNMELCYTAPGELLQWFML